MENQMKERTNSHLLLLLLLAIAGMLMGSLLTTGHNWGDDFSAYIMQARSLSEGNPRGFVEENRFTIQQSSSLIGPDVYPWGFPALLAPVYAVSKLNMIALKSVGVSCFLLFLVVLWFCFRRYHSGVWLAALVCLFGLNPNMLRFTDEILSDVPFLLVSTLSVMMIQRVVVEKRAIVSPLLDHVLLGAAIASSFFVRTNGILLLFTLAIAQGIALVQKMRQDDTISPALADRLRSLSADNRSILHVVPYLVFVAFTVALGIALPAPSGGTYDASRVMATSLDLIKDQVKYYIALPGAFFAGVPHTPVVYGASIPLVVAGVLSRYRSDYAILVYVTMTFLLCMIFPGVQGLRYLFPVLPFYTSFMLTGLEGFVAGSDNRRLRKIICVVSAVYVLGCLGMQSVAESFENLRSNREAQLGPFVQTSRDMFSFIERNVEKEKTIVFFKPRLMRMMTGRRAVMIRNVAELSRGDYVCIYLRRDAYAQITPDAIRQLVARGALQLVYENGDFILFRLTKGTA